MTIQETLQIPEAKTELLAYTSQFPLCISTAAQSLGFLCEASDFPTFQIDFEGKYPPQRPLAISIIENTGDGRTLFVNPETLTSCAADIMCSLQIPTENPDQLLRLEQYCLLQAAVYLELQASSLKLSYGDIRKIQDEYTIEFIIQMN